MRSFVLRYLALLVAIATAGCTPWYDTFPPAPPQTITRTTQRDAARVLLLDRCPVVGKKSAGQTFAFAGIAVAGAEAIANVAITAVADYIQQAQNDLTATYTATGADILFDSSGALAKNCLVVVRGSFGAAVPNNVPDQSGILNKKMLPELGLADYPKFYFEAWIASDTQGSPQRILLTPTALQFADTAAKNPGDGVKTIDILLTFASEPQTPNGAATNPVPPPKPNQPGQANSPQSKPGTEKANPPPQKPANATQTATANVAAVPFEFSKIARGTAIATTTDDADTPKNPLFDQRRATTIAAGGSGGSVRGNLNLYAMVTETDNSSAFMKIILSTLPQNQKSIEDAINNAIANALSKPAPKK